MLKAQADTSSITNNTQNGRSAFGGYSVELAEANVSELYTVCALFCCVCTMYNPETYVRPLEL
jgi:hypothetical protein